MEIDTSGLDNLINMFEAIDNNKYIFNINEKTGEINIENADGLNKETKEFLINCYKENMNK